MNKTIRWLSAYLVPVTLFGMTEFLIYHGVQGWGWFLFGVLFYVGSVSFDVGAANRANTNESSLMEQTA